MKYPRAIVQAIAIMLAALGFVVVSAMVWNLATGTLIIDLRQTNCPS